MQIDCATDYICCRENWILGHVLKVSLRNSAEEISWPMHLEHASENEMCMWSSWLGSNLETWMKHMPRWVKIREQLMFLMMAVIWFYWQSVRNICLIWFPLNLLNPMSCRIQNLAQGCMGSLTRFPWRLRSRSRGVWTITCTWWCATAELSGKRLTLISDWQLGFW